MPFYASMFCLAFSVWLFVKQKSRLSIFLLFIAALILRIWIIGLDPFLWDWDERFHALVAKNLSQNPWQPVLIKYPLYGYDYTDWSANYIWLHKQPLFLYQMALSIKLIGTTEFAVRLPSAILGALQTLLIFQIGSYVKSSLAGYVAAFLWSLSYFSLQLTSGYYGMDHNDVSFTFYVTLSFYLFACYTIRPCVKPAF